MCEPVYVPCWWFFFSLYFTLLAHCSLSQLSDGCRWGRCAVLKVNLIFLHFWIVFLWQSKPGRRVTQWWSVWFNLTIHKASISELCLWGLVENRWVPDVWRRQRKVQEIYSSPSCFEGGCEAGYLQSVYQANRIFSCGRVAGPAVSSRFGVSMISNSRDTASCLPFSQKEKKNRDSARAWHPEH